jgi:hypothetical protein
MKRNTRIGITVLAITALSAVLAASVLAAPTHNAKITIRHATHGCHLWSYAGGAYKSSLKITLGRGAVLTVVDNDVMPHKLVQTSGPKAKLMTPAMKHMSAVAHVTFAKAGVYKLTTRAGEDYPSAKGIKTTGEDNVLRLTVTVK